jgi:hypothetical protein
MVGGEAFEDVRRPLGTSELFFYNHEQLSPVNAVAMVRVSGGLTPSLTREALDLLQREEPMLRACIQGGAAPRWVPCDGKIPLESLPRVTEADFVSCAESELNRRFPLQRGPLSRLTLLTGAAHADLVFSFHHTVIDGGALRYLSRRLVEIADALLSGCPVQPKPGPSLDYPDPAVPAAWLEPLPDAASAPPPPSEILAKGNNPWGDELRARLRVVTLDAEHTASIIRRARDEKTTIQGTLLAAVLLAARVLLRPSPDDPSSSRISIASAVDLRPMLTRDAGRGAGNFSAGFVTTHVLDRHTRFWPLAREAKAQISESIARGGPWVGMRLMAPIGGNAQALESVATMVALVTNIGRGGGGSPLSRLSFERFRFAAPVGPCTGNALIAAVSTHDDEMHITFGHPDGLLPDDVAVSFINEILGRLRTECF